MKGKLHHTRLKCAISVETCISAVAEIMYLIEKFVREVGFGPVTVREFMAESAALGDMTTAQVELDAFRQVRAWLDALGF